MNDKLVVIEIRVRDFIWVLELELDYNFVFADVFHVPLYWDHLAIA